MTNLLAKVFLSSWSLLG